MSVILADMIEVQQHFFFISFMTEMERLLLVTLEGLIMSIFVIIRCYNSFK